MAGPPRQTDPDRDPDPRTNSRRDGRLPAVPGIAPPSIAGDMADDSSPGTGCARYNRYDPPGGPDPSRSKLDKRNTARYIMLGGIRGFVVGNACLRAAVAPSL